MERRQVVVMGVFSTFVTRAGEDEKVIAGNHAGGVMACAVVAWTDGDQACERPCQKVFREGEGEAAAFGDASVDLRMNHPVELRDIIVGKMEFDVGAWYVDIEQLVAEAVLYLRDFERTVWILNAFQNGANVGEACVSTHKEDNRLVVWIEKWMLRIVNTQNGGFKDAGGGMTGLEIRRQGWNA